VSGDSQIQIRSFTNCFKLERRIHKIDRWRMPLPFGIPLRGIGYAVGIELAVVVLTSLPVTDLVLRRLAAPVRFGVLPIVLAFVLASWEVDGRPAHAALRSWVGWMLTPSRVTAWRPTAQCGLVHLAQVTVAHDDHGARVRPSSIAGPARVLMRYPFKARAARRTLVVTSEPGEPCWRGKEIVLKHGQRMVIW
jgi:hypothetical protein